MKIEKFKPKFSIFENFKRKHKIKKMNLDPILSEDFEDQHIDNQINRKVIKFEKMLMDKINKQEQEKNKLRLEKTQKETELEWLKEYYIKLENMKGENKDG